MTTVLRTPERRLVYGLFEAAVAAVHGSRCVADYLRIHPITRPVAVVAIGKAASEMAAGARGQLGDKLAQALIITKQGYLAARLQADARFECMESAHPVPDQRSLDAGDRLCRYLAALPGSMAVLFLISGGSSSLVEVLAEHVQPDELARANQWLQASGLAITQINRIRGRLSRIKGGGLLACMGERPVTVLLISDVPDDDPAVIGSGLLLPGKPAVAAVQLPDWFPRMVQSPHDPAPAVRTPCHHIVATNHQALCAARDKGRALGHATTLITEPLSGDAAQAGQAIARYLQQAPDGLYLWGGETTVVLPQAAPPGGRNLHLALAAANALSADTDIVMLAAGTDGNDGTSGFAGAIIDDTTMARGVALRLDAGTSLQQAGAASYLAACGDALLTGPTGTNVMDMVIAIKGQ